MLYENLGTSELSNENVNYFCRKGPSQRLSQHFWGKLKCHEKTFDSAILPAVSLFVGIDVKVKLYI